MCEPSKNFRLSEKIQALPLTIVAKFYGWGCLISPVSIKPTFVVQLAKYSSVACISLPGTAFHWWIDYTLHMTAFMENAFTVHGWLPNNTSLEKPVVYTARLAKRRGYDENFFRKKLPLFSRLNARPINHRFEKETSIRFGLDAVDERENDREGM